jgi:hypothetical protein
VHKERFAARVWEKNGLADDETFQRLYGSTRGELFAEFRSARPGARSEARSKKTSRSARPEPPRSAAEGRVEGAEQNGHDADGIGAAIHNISLAELTEFTYWLFRRRVSGSEPARVASDTRKGVAMRQRLEALRRRTALVSS